MKQSLICLLVALLVPVAVNAQTSTHDDVLTTTTTTGVPSILDGLHFIAGIHSWIDSGRVSELQSQTGNEETSLTEYFFGAKNAAGWGVYGQAVENQTTKWNSSQNTFLPGDPSISITHPIYDSPTLKMSGKLREYFQVSSWAVTNHVYQQAYYLESLYLMKHKWEMFNLLIPRYFSQPSYAASDTTIYGEDWTYVGNRINPRLRVGVGQHAQVESHFQTPVGKDWDIFPYADFMASNSIYFGPRIYFPIYAQNSVFEGDKGVSLSNVTFELYVQAHL